MFRLGVKKEMETTNQTTNKTLSTGQVSGLLGIPNVTIQRYVKDFKEFFSVKAQQPNRGRRYEPSDVSNLVTIRNMHTRHAGNQEITKVLEAGKDAQAIHVPEIFTILDIANKAMAITEENVTNVESLSRRAAWRGPEYLNLLSEMRQAIRDLKHEQDILRFELFRLKFIFRHPRSLPPKRPRVLLNIWQQFQQWTASEFEKDLRHIQQERERIEESRAGYLKDHPQYRDDLD
jgi:DNA-binding transcriptional MerR regulator